MDYLIKFFKFTEQVIDLLTAIGVPGVVEGVSYTTGIDNYPAFTMNSNAYIRKTVQELFGSALRYLNFALTLTVRPKTRDPSYIFSVKNPHDTVIVLGLYLEPSTVRGQDNLVLYYTENARFNTRGPSTVLGNFTINSLYDRWTELAFKVEERSVTLYVNCVQVGSQRIRRSGRLLSFEPGSALYIAQGGPNFEGQFVVRCICLLIC